MIFTKLKTWLLAVAAIALSVLGLVVKILTAKNSRLRREVDTARARVKHQEAVITADNKIEEATRDKEEEIAKEIKEKGASEELNNPNDWEWYNDEDGP